MDSRPYLGKAGQLAVMAELAFLGYNVSIPEVDKGDDVFAVNDETGNMYRLQVKTATAFKQKESHRCQFSLRVDQLEKAHTPELHYCFTAKIEEKWEFIVVTRTVLQHLVSVDDIGTKAKLKSGKESLTLTITFQDDGRCTCSKKDLQTYRNNWSQTWPSLKT